MWSKTRRSEKPKGLRILALVTDAHGGFGGISQYNRDALEAMCRFDTVGEVLVLPRIAHLPLSPLPDKLHYYMGGLGGVLKYSAYAIAAGLRLRHVDLIYCAHVNLMPVAMAVSKLLGAPLVLAIYGVEVWQPAKWLQRSAILSGVSAVVSISKLTRDRFLAWCPYLRERTFIVPNAIRLKDYGIKPKNESLIERYGLRGKTVLMTFGRMAAEERLKGFDRVINMLPGLVQDIPSLVYLAAGEGTDRPTLEALALRRNIKDRVVFTGRVDEDIKSDLYRLADVYIMPSVGEGFGFVVIEALACGVPVVASSRDGTREAVRDGALGIVVDPFDQAALRSGVLEALKRPREIAPGLEYFAYERFCERLKTALASVCEI